MKLRPLGNRITVRVDEVKTEEVSEGGIHLPKMNFKGEMYKKEQLEMGTDTGIVIEIGNQVDEKYTDGLRVGDRVMFSRYEGGCKIVDGEVHRVLYDTTIWAKVED